ncbi:hypothetical protein F66182_346 [Fusarium sp. NRRL 66182]|nr:hypothetical protein F66182_346 [Fusarium sp. NRRL 66182]
MARSLALLAAAVVAVAAQTTTVDFLLPLYDPQPLEGSVVAVKDGATTLAINCPKSADSSECGLVSRETVVGGPSTMHVTYSIPAMDEEYGAASQDFQCKLDPKKDIASCSVTVVQTVNGSVATTSTAVVNSGYKSALIPITVTAGVNKLNAEDDQDASAAPGASATDADVTSASRPRATDAAATETADATSSTSDADAAATPTNSDNAAGAVVTQNAILAVAAVIGGAAMLL